MSELEETIRKIAREEAAKLVETQVADAMRRISIRPVQQEKLVDAAAIAELIGEDVSTKEKLRKATAKVYDLASRNLIPSVRLSTKRIRFYPSKVEEVLKRGGNAEPYSERAAS